MNEKHGNASESEETQKAPNLYYDSHRLGAFLWKCLLINMTHILGYINFPSPVLTESGSMGIISADFLSTP